MDAEHREKFYNTLLTLDGIDTEKDGQILADSIQYPKSLYRFRPVSFSSLDALQTNKLFFSSADHYDDPFDSYLYIDIPQVECEIKAFFERKSSADRNLVITLSKVAGIPIIYECYTEYGELKRRMRLFAN